MPFRKAISAACAALALTAGAAAASEPERSPLGLMGTIPIFWGEAAGFGDLLSGGDVRLHWARAILSADFDLRPLDYLDGEALGQLDYLLLAQPRALSGEENVALDAWVREGGKLLLFADPMMTGHSRYGIGDRRRPQDVILLSPILDHWGLTLEFVEDQDAGRHSVPALGMSIPVNLPGRVKLAHSDGACELSPTQVVVQCRIGQGRVVVVADAAVLDIEDSSPASAAAIKALLAASFGNSGESAGN